MSVFAALEAYVDHPDPATRLANSIALLVGSNGPFYPLYVWWLLPEAGLAALATMAASPGFIAIPWLARRHALVARATLPLLGLANTVWTVALLGAATGAGAFVFPCILLAGLCWREPRVIVFLLGTGLVMQQLVLHWPLAPLTGLDPVLQAQLVRLNASSVAALLCFIVFAIARQLRLAAR